MEAANACTCCERRPGNDEDGLCDPCFYEKRAREQGEEDEARADWAADSAMERDRDDERDGR